MKVTTLDEASIRDIGQAFGYYDYGEEHGLIDAFPEPGRPRRPSSAAMCAWRCRAGCCTRRARAARATLPISARGRSSRCGRCSRWQRGFSVPWIFLRSVRFTRIMAQGGQGLDKRLDREKKPYIFVGLVCVRQAYQGQGYMRKVMEMAFAEGDRAGHSGDPGDRRPVQMRQIPASWHEACRYAPVRYARSALRPHPIPGNKIKTDSRPHRRCTTPGGRDFFASFRPSAAAACCGMYRKRRAVP